VHLEHSLRVTEGKQGRSSDERSFSAETRVEQGETGGSTDLHVAPEDGRRPTSNLESSRGGEGGNEEGEEEV
jgi:hypothetical protein